MENLLTILKVFKESVMDVDEGLRLYHATRRAIDKIRTDGPAATLTQPEQRAVKQALQEALEYSEIRGQVLESLEEASALGIHITYDLY